MLQEYLPLGSKLKKKYIVKSFLGAGGFSNTYKAYDTEINEYVAIKEYFPEKLIKRSSDGFNIILKHYKQKEVFQYGLAKFIDEANLLNKFAHNPCVISIIDFFSENGTAYLVMNYLDGVTLQEYVEIKGGKIDFLLACKIMIQIMDVLNEMHSANILHRDISPDNIYLSKEGHVKLLDFGSARYATQNLDEDDTIFLKPGYSPPEQYKNLENQGPWTDVYAVSATLYQAITGNMPQDAMKRLENDELLKASELDSSIPNELATLLCEGLVLNKNERIQSVKDLQKNLLEKIANDLVDEKQINDFFIDELSEAIPISILNQRSKDKLYVFILIGLNFVSLVLFALLLYYVSDTIGIIFLLFTIIANILVILRLSNTKNQAHKQKTQVRIEKIRMEEI